MDSNLLLELHLISPLLVVAGGSLVLLLFDVGIKGSWSRSLVTILLLVMALISCVNSAIRADQGMRIFRGLLYADPFTYFFTFVLIAGSLIVCFTGAKQLVREGIKDRSEYYSLLLMSTAGGIIFVSAAELITWFLGLEIMSMALYCLCASSLKHKRSTEAALKYFLLGSFSSAFLLYGIALLYGVTGSTEIALIVKGGLEKGPVLYTALGLLLFGVVFKIGLVPFHFWTPDVYQGSPTSVTAYMACVVKAASIGAGLRILWGLFPDLIEVWQGAVWCIAVMTLVVGNVVALQQKSLKRMLAYSSIGHAGYIFMAFLAPQTAGPAILYYLIVYTVMTMGAFGVVLALTVGKAEDAQADSITKLNGFGYTNPVLAAVMALFMLSLAGIPPGMGGLLGKVYLFSAVIKAEYYGLAIIAVLSASVACFYYLRVIVAMYFLEPDGESEVISLESSLVSALTLCALGVVLLGLFPSVVYDGATGIMMGWK